MKDVSTWLPKAVVAVTVIGFAALAWYAYRTGTQSLREEDLLVIEADKTPLKELPENPGGMNFPNQDKTVFETFGAAGAAPPKVERVLPPPEEPIAKKLDTSETRTWINEKLKKKEEEESASAGRLQPVELPKPLPQALPQTPPPTVETKIEKLPAPKTVETKPEASAGMSASEPSTEASKPKEEKKDIAVTTPTKPKKDSGARVQLGAYQSEAEAKAEFAKMQKKFSSLSGKKPIIVKADLGAKGVYYRLRVGGFSDAAEASALCKSLFAKGQACIVAK